MTGTFGETLRQIRIDSGLGLRELARLIDKSPGYLSDVENGRVPPPSEAVIIDISAALEVDKKGLLFAARKVDPELSEYVARKSEVADFLRMARDRGFENEDWHKMTRLAKTEALGKRRKDKR